MTNGVQLGLFGGSDLSQPQDRDRWCTPAWVVALVREALGAIDLDPASNERAQGVVQAATWYSLDVGRDGLELPWAGRVYCNPPYGRGIINAFADKIVCELDRGEIDALIVLVNTSSSASWWQQLARRADAIVYPDSRLAFWHAETGKTRTGNEYDQTLFVYGLVDLEPLEQLGLVIPKQPAPSKELAPLPTGEDDWSDLGRADELTGMCWAMLDDLTAGWPGWRGGMYDRAHPAADERDLQARAVADALKGVGELVELLWHKPEPKQPSKHHTRLWERLTQAHSALAQLGATSPLFTPR